MSKLNIFDDDYAVNRDDDHVVNRDPITIDPAIRDNIVEQIQEPQVPKLRITRSQLDAIKAERERREITGSYYRYVLKCRPDLKPTRLHEYVAGTIQEFLERPGRDDGTEFLLISLPFQVGKTTWGAQSIPAWFMQRRPGSNCIIVSYSEAFAMKASAENKRKIEWNIDLWPGAEIGNKWTNKEFEVIFDKKNNIKSTCLSATMGTVNGNPADVVIIDDTCHDSTEANSDTFNTSLEENWLSVVRSRIRVGGKCIVMQTRWNMRDIFEVIKGVENPDSIQVLNIPCECVDPENDPLGRQLGDGPCPEIGKDRKWVQAFKQAYIRKGNMMTWENNYQGNPTIGTGNIFKHKHFRTCEFGKITDQGLQHKDGSLTIWPCVALSVDAALKHEEDNDFNALQVWAKLEDDYFLLHAEKGHYSFPELLNRIYALGDRFKLNYRYIEEAANGAAAIDMLNSAKVRNVIAVKPEGGKYSRAMAVSWLFETGRCYFDKEAEYFDEYQDSMCQFPKGKHDDDVDATTQALNRMTMLAAHESVAVEHVAKPCHWSEDMILDYENATDSERVYLRSVWGNPPSYVYALQGAALDLGL